MTNATQKVKSRVTRSAAIEWTRVLSSIGIVMFHGETPFRSVSLGGLIAFTVIGVAFIKPVESASAFGHTLWPRAQRLLTPWIGWSIVYGALRAGEAAWRHTPAMSWWDGRMWLYGTFIHLWFLPYLFVVTVVVQMLDLSSRHVRISVITVVGWALVATMPVWVRLEHTSAGAPFIQWFSVLPAVGMGILMRGATPGVKATKWRILRLLFLEAFAVGLTYYLMPYRAGSLVKHIVGGLAVLAWASSSPASRTALTLGALSMGVYLVHPLLYIAGERILSLSQGSAQMAMEVIVASFVVSGGLVWIDRRLRPIILHSTGLLKTLALRRQSEQA